MDAHEREFFGAIEGMQDTYGVVPTPPVTVVLGTRCIPTWNVNATVTWTDAQGHHRHGHVMAIRYAGADESADQRIYVVKTRDPVSLQPRHVELTHDALCEW